MIGVTLFFMISGAALMYNYGDTKNLKKYFKKRFLGIYPMYWIAYIGVFLYIFYHSKGILYGDMPKYKFLYSFFAMDGYLSAYTTTPYILGEWFIGCIILIYLLFPLYKELLNRFPKTFLIISTILNFSLIIFYKNGIMPINKNIIVCSYSFILGMYAIKYLKNIKLWQMLSALATFIILYVCFSKINIESQNVNVLIANLIGYSLYIILAYLGEKINESRIQKLFTTIGKYSYAIFLMHHYIIMKMESTFANIDLHTSGTIALFVSCFVVIVFWSIVLYAINNKITRKVLD